MANITITPFRVGSSAPQAVRQLNLTPSAIAPYATSIETFSGANVSQSNISDLASDSMAFVWGPSLPVGLTVEQARITGTGVLEITFYNATGNTITPVSQQFNLLVV